MAFSTNVLAILASTAILIVACQGTPITAKQQEDFTEIGTINGKTYLTPKNDTQISWYGGRDMCAMYGLELASFVDREEFQFVRSNVEYTTKLWIGASIPGQNSGTLKTNDAFKWLDGSYFADINFLHSPEHWLCVIFNADDHLYTESCTRGMYNPLCQTTN